MGPLNFEASFGKAPAPFKIKVEPDFIALTKQKVSLTRMVEDVEQPDYSDGPPIHFASSVRNYWAREYDWESVQDRLNSALSQYTTTVELPASSSYKKYVPLHFVHHTSSRSDAIPLLFIHGWPGSFLEVQNIIEELTNPSQADAQAFHVVAPSVPGFAFSPAPTSPGFGYIESAHAFDALMKQLNYSKYVIQGGDLGGLILRHQAYLYPDSVISCLSNFWVVAPNQSDLERYRDNKTTADETATIQNYEGFTKNSWSYGQIQQQRPLRLGFGLTDSPVGLAMWIYDAMWPGVSDPSFWSTEDIITWTMMHWIQGPYGATRIYREAAKSGSLTLNGVGDFPYVKQPVAISEFVRDIWYQTPLDWAQRLGNVKYRTVHNTGGHYPSTETPSLLIDDIRKFFGNTEMSGTGVFSANTHT
ncbi:putative epoxide hydrolase [Lachnellula occidentalis]|uniref:Putative epoxide hydrolase n=1 Tax=Lachnellula occidentalis TaxID=215460 RepID=A0A8H8UGE8_9HELO|nr:putative epoxide hydrolase [Lachnellula occidentalis]